MKENENKGPSSTAGAAKGGNTNTEIIGSAVSTAVGEPVATDLPHELSEAIMANLFDREDVLDGIDDDLLAEIRAEMRETIAARLAAPTQAKPVDLSGLTRYDIEHDGCGWMRDCIKGDYVKFADVESLLAAPTQVSAPQASAAQEVRAVPEGWREVIQGMRDASYTITQYSETADVVFDSVMDALDELEAAPTSTSTAPAAMDEVRNQALEAIEAAVDVLDAFGNLPDGMMHPSPWNERKAEAKIKAARDAIRALKTSQPSLDEVTGAGKGEA